MEEEDTIELIDLLRFLWKWKWLIIAFSLTCAIAAGIISFSMNEVYKVSMVIEPGVIDIDPNDNLVYLDSASNVKSKIDSQAYNRRIFDKLLADPKEVNRRFETTVILSLIELSLPIKCMHNSRMISVITFLVL